MKTSLLTKTAGLGLLLSAFLATNALAGPGPQYWAAQGKQAPAAKEAPAADHFVCPDHQVVADTLMRPAMANGKGPLVSVQIGTKTVCHMCPVITVVAQSASPNGRGPIKRTEVTKVGAEHTCTACAPSAKS